MREIRIQIASDVSNRRVWEIESEVTDFFDDNFPSDYLLISSGPVDNDSDAWHRSAEETMHAMIQAEELAGTVNAVFNGG